MTKYNIGDKVKVRSDLKLGTYGMEDSSVNDSVIDEMLVYKGREVTISDVFEEYSIVEDNWEWCWTDEMFED